MINIANVASRLVAEQRDMVQGRSQDFGERGAITDERGRKAPYV